MDEPRFTLVSDGLLSKWGFNDGDCPDDVCDYITEAGWNFIEWHPVLTKLVEDYLVPALDQRVELARISTAHNPVRASSVDGHDTEACWTGRNVSGEPELTPETVDVPMSVVVGVALELNALRKA